MALSQEQLIMLDTLIYSDRVSNGSSIGTIVTQMRADIRANRTIGGASMSNQEWSELLDVIEKQPSLMNYTVQNLETRSSGMRVACFVDDVQTPTDVNVVFRGTSSDNEWKDNGSGGYLPDSAIQKEAAEYVKNLPAEYGNNMTVSGHSKGGNLAQYVTVTMAKTEYDRIANCVSIDGQGFSEEFMAKYADEIADKRNNITSISAENDVVNSLLYSVSGNRIYIKTEEQPGIFDYHKPAILLDSNGNLREKTSQSEIAVFFNEYTTSLISNMPEPMRSAMLDNAMLIVVSCFSGQFTMEDIFRTAGVIVGALDYVDNFIFHEIGQRYGIAAELLATYVAALCMPCVYLDDLLYAAGKAVGTVVAAMQNLADAVYKKLVSFGEQAKAFAEHFIQSFNKFAQSVTHWINKNVNPGYRYAEANPYINVDTAKLRAYAQRLAAVNKRIAALDKRLNRLYKKLDLGDMWTLMTADLLVDQSLRLKSCEKYLNETASDFDKVEQDVARLF